MQIIEVNTTTTFFCLSSFAKVWKDSFPTTLLYLRAFGAYKFPPFQRNKLIHGRACFNVFPRLNFFDRVFVQVLVCWLIVFSKKTKNRNRQNRNGTFIISSSYGTSREKGWNMERKIKWAIDRHRRPRARRYWVEKSQPVYHRTLFTKHMTTYNLHFCKINTEKTI